MKHFLLILVFFFITWNLQARIPNPFHKSVKGLAKKFIRKYPNDSLRTEAIYKWINRYMSYDYRAYRKYKWKINNYSSSRILYRRKAICYGFSKLFREICQASHISCNILEGYTYENIDDPFDHYYYSDHAWNAVRLNGYWYLCDLTFDNGYIKLKSRRLLKLINSITGIAFIYSKHKYVHRPTFNYCMQENYIFYPSHYPLLPNALLSKTKITLKEFKYSSTPSYSEYNTCMDSSYVVQDVYLTRNKPDKMRTTGHEALRSNPTNHLNITLSYSNSLAYQGKISRLKYSSSIDTINKYGRAFLKDNQYLHSINTRRINKEHASLLGIWKRINTGNNGNYSYYKNGSVQYKNRSKRAQKNNSRRAMQDEITYQNTVNATAIYKKTDTLTYENLILQHHKITHICDSVKATFSKNQSELELLYKEHERLYQQLNKAISEQITYLGSAITSDMALEPYPAVLVWYTKADSLSSVIGKYKDSINVVNRNYLNARGKAIRVTNLGYQYAKRDYKQTSAIRKSFSMYYDDNIAYQYEAHTQLLFMKSSLRDLYHLEQSLYRNLYSEYRSLYKRFRKNRKRINSLYMVRALALDSRTRHENSRFKAYNNLVNGILLQIKYIKK